MCEKIIGLLLREYGSRLSTLIAQLESDLAGLDLPREDVNRYIGKNMLPGVDLDPEHWVSEPTGDLIVLAGLRQFRDAIDTGVALLLGEESDHVKAGGTS